MGPEDKTTVHRKPKRVYITTIISTSMVLLVLGLLGILLIQAKNLSGYIKENVVLNVVFNVDAKDTTVKQLQNEINVHRYVKKSVYVNKEEAAKTLSHDLGEDFVKFLGYNPLSPTLDIYLNKNYARNDSIADIKTTLLQNPLVKEVNYQESLVENLSKNIQTISLILLVFSIVLIIVAISLINNTVQLAIYSQRFIIKSMQLVGATRSFIRRPFIWLGILHGLLAGLIAVILLVLLLVAAKREMPEWATLWNYFEFGFVFVAMFLTGLILSFFSSYFAVSKYLRTGISELYH